ncbi:MAG: hypothetical protein ABSF18_07520 [Gammaproteobacteria bacterium]
MIKRHIVSIFMLVALTMPAFAQTTANMDLIVKQMDAAAQQAMKASGTPLG